VRRKGQLQARKSHFILHILSITINQWGHAVAQWLNHRATNQKVAESIPDGVTGIFH
jgi:hypothetical protein